MSEVTFFRFAHQFFSLVWKLTLMVDLTISYVITYMYISYNFFLYCFKDAKMVFFYLLSLLPWNWLHLATNMPFSYLQVWKRWIAIITIMNISHIISVDFTVSNLAKLQQKYEHFILLISFCNFIAHNK